MAILNEEALSRSVAERAVPLGGSLGAFDPLLAMIGDARLVLLGGATHGTHEFYRMRAQITKRLILEKGFCAVAIEGDWPDAHRVDRYVRALGADTDAADALGDFERFPSWMWRNVDIAELVSWLRAHNDGVHPPVRRVGFHGLDLHSLHASLGAAPGSRVAAWNLRALHLADTLDALLGRFDPAKIVVWGHNAQVGDARATERGDEGEINLGQLARERHGAAVRLIGFMLYTGTVTAASRWGGVTERKAVCPALPDSHEALFHRASIPDFLLVLRGLNGAREALRAPRLQRSIGVIYRPWTERVSHYQRARLADQLDAVVHIDRTTALRPLDWSGPWERAETPETSPTRL